MIKNQINVPARVNDPFKESCRLQGKFTHIHTECKYSKYDPLMTLASKLKFHIL